MGCGGSKKAPGPRNDEPPIDPIDVPDTDPNYPPPQPPKDVKHDIYKDSDYTNIDNRVKQYARTKPSTYEQLVQTLKTHCTTDLQKLRAIFVWLFHQDIYGSFYNGVVDPHTPTGYMKLIKTGKGSYVSFFAQLCRAADIPCVVVRGTGKGDKYDVGQQDMSGLDCAWNAVYVANGWRFVHPLWAYFKEKQVYEKGQPPPAGTKRPSIHEFFWLVDPEKLICFCEPKNAEWQLLRSKWDHKKFLKSPQFTEDYFPSGFMLPKRYNATVNSENGLCFIDFDHDAYDEFDLRGEVTFNEDMSSDRLPAHVNMKDYITTSGSSTTKSIIVRFPAKGRYNLDVYGGSDKQMPKIVEFRLECSETHSHPRPFPLNPKDGFGISPAADKLGVSDLDPDGGLVFVKVRQEKRFSFNTSQRLAVQATMHHGDLNPSDFDDFINVKASNDHVDVHVTIPEEKVLEFGLEIAARPESSAAAFTPVANYLLVDENWKKKTAVVAPNAKPKKNEERLRKALINATQRGDIADLEKAIADFEENGLKDNGDLTRARDMLLHLHLENLRIATKRRKLDELDKAIENARKSRVSSEIIETKEFSDAEAARRQLKRLKLYLHKVLELKQSTISEIHSYNRPRPLVHTVMKATFRILGEPNSKIQEWRYIQNSMRQLGRNSIINRMKKYDIVSMKEKQAMDADMYLGATNQHVVRMCSAGAGTFYVWSHNMISEHQGKKEVNPLDLFTPRGRDNKDNADNNYSNNNNNNNNTNNSYKPGHDVNDDSYSHSRSPDHTFGRRTPGNNSRGNSPYNNPHDNTSAYDNSRRRDSDGWDPNNNWTSRSRNATPRSRNATPRDLHDDWDPNAPPRNDRRHGNSPMY